MAFAFVQGVGGFAVATSVTLTWPGATTIGNLGIASTLLTNTDTVTSVTDTAGTTYVKTTSSPVDNGGAGIKIYQWYGVQAGAATTITGNRSVSGVIAMDVNEYSGNAASSVFDKDSTGSSAGSTSMSVASFTPTADGELIVASIAHLSGTMTAGANYTLDGIRNQLEYRLSSSGAETAPATISSAQPWAEVAGAYVPAASGVTITATGSAHSTDTASVTLSHPITAAGAGHSTDTASVTDSIPIAGTSPAHSTDTATVTDAIPITATSAAHSADQADVTLAHPITATGSAHSTDSADVSVPTVTQIGCTGPGSAGSRCTITSSADFIPATGVRLEGIRDYSVWVPDDWRLQLPKTYAHVGELVLPPAVLASATALVRNAALGDIAAAALTCNAVVTRSVQRCAGEITVRGRPVTRVMHLALLKRTLIAHSVVDGRGDPRVLSEQEELQALGVL